MQIDMLYIHHEVNHAMAATKYECRPDPAKNTFTEDTKYSYVPPRPALLIQDLLLQQLVDNGIEDPLTYFCEFSKEDLVDFEWVRTEGFGMRYGWSLPNGYIFEYQVTLYPHGLVAHTPIADEIEETTEEPAPSEEFVELMEGHSLHGDSGPDY